MAMISRIPCCLSFSSSQCWKPFFYLHHQQQLCTSDRNSRNKHGFVCFACSFKRTRVRKKVKSDEELRSEILDFVALVGLPEGHVPSMKELSNNGRNDLARIVRRRGYKFIRQLVADQKMEEHQELDFKKTTNVKQSSGGACEQDSLAEGQGERPQDVGEEDLPSSRFSSTERCSAVSDGNTSHNWENSNSERGNVIPILTPNAEEQGSAVEAESSLSGVSSVLNLSLGLHPNLDYHSSSGRIRKDDLITKSTEVNNVVDNEILSSEADTSGEVSLVLEEVPSCLDKEDDNVLMTKDEEVNYVGKYTSSSTDISTFEHYTTPDSNSINHAGERDDKTQMFRDSPVTSSIEEKVTRFIQNGYLDTIEDDNHGSQGNASMVSNGTALASDEVTRAAGVNSFDRDYQLRDSKANLHKDFHDENMRRENQVEINHLKFLLHQKELELSRLKEQIDKEKLALSLLQRKAETEIDKAQKLIQEKDAELYAAEGSLLGLKEVEIDYCGDGDVVEVSGSFNGWQHRVEMELQSTNGIGNQRRWSTILWLYPGTYEIKFIVDGQWKIDPQRGSVTRAHITNNILKVDR